MLALVVGRRWGLQERGQVWMGGWNGWGWWLRLGREQLERKAGLVRAASSSRTFCLLAGPGLPSRLGLHRGGGARQHCSPGTRHLAHRRGQRVSTELTGWVSGSRACDGLA